MRPSPLVGTQLPKNLGWQRNPGCRVERLEFQRVAGILWRIEETERAQLFPAIHLDGNQPCHGASSLGDLDNCTLFDAIQDARGEVPKLSHRHLIHGYDRSTWLNEIQGHLMARLLRQDGRARDDFARRTPIASTATRPGAVNALDVTETRKRYALCGVAVVATSGK